MKKFIIVRYDAQLEQTKYVQKLDNNVTETVFNPLNAMWTNDKKDLIKMKNIIEKLYSSYFFFIAELQIN